MTHLCIKPHCGPDCSMCNGAVPLSRAAVDVLAERQRVITSEGWTPEHDDEHTRCELARAAASYLCRSDALMLAGTRVWPEGWEFKPAGYRRVLVKACQLALAELERLDRYSQQPGVAVGVDVAADRLTVHLAIPAGEADPLNPAISQALDRLRQVDRSIWDDITSALKAAAKDHCDPSLDELDSRLLLDLLWLYRHANPLPGADASSDRLIVTAALPGEIMESFVWNDAQAKKPDSDITHLCWSDDGYFCGWWDAGSEQWIACESGGTVLGVTHWADPQGPEL